MRFIKLEFMLNAKTWNLNITSRANTGEVKAISSVHVDSLLMNPIIIGVTSTSRYVHWPGTLAAVALALAMSIHWQVAISGCANAGQYACTGMSVGPAAMSYAALPCRGALPLQCNTEQAK